MHTPIQFNRALLASGIHISLNLFYLIAESLVFDRDFAVLRSERLSHDFFSKDLVVCVEYSLCLEAAFLENHLPCQNVDLSQPYNCYPTLR